MHDCPRCGVGLHDESLCESCGWTEAIQVAAPVVKALPPPPDCSWVGRYGRCVMLATIWLDPYGNRHEKTGEHIRPGYCGWHYETHEMSRLGGNFDEFESWHAYKRRRYCTQFSHHDAAYLWSALDGLRRDYAARFTIQPCRAFDCWVWATLEREKIASAWTPPEAGGSIHALAGALVRKFTLPTQPDRMSRGHARRRG